MNNTNAAQVMSQALWPGPGPEIAEWTDAFGASAGRAELLMYASKSATRCSSEGEPVGVTVCPKAEDTTTSKVSEKMILKAFEHLELRIRASCNGPSQTSQGRNVSIPLSGRLNPDAGNRSDGTVNGCIYKTFSSFVLQFIIGYGTAAAKRFVATFAARLFA